MGVPLNVIDYRCFWKAVSAMQKAEYQVKFHNSSNRGKAVPGGVCGFWGACGVGISAGVFISIISGATPLKNESWGLANKMTFKALDAIGSIGGPRCCKRDSYMAIISAIDYVAENFNIQMEKPVIKCIHSGKNNQCIKERCPFHE